MVPMDGWGCQIPDRPTRKDGKSCCFRLWFRVVILLELLKRPEGKTLEFKRDLSSPNGVLRSIIAFANTAGGTLLIGVEDKSRHVRGVKDPLATEERLANLLSDNIAPRLVPELEILPWRRTHVLALQVFPSHARPHYLRATGLENGAYVRVGSTNRRADSEMIAELGRFARGESFDEQPLPELDSEALDFRVASELFAPVRRLKPRDLETLKLITRHQGRKVPTVGGLLLFGKERDRYFPDAWIQAGRFQGKDRSHIVDTVEIHAHLPLAVEQAIAFVRKHDTRAAEIGPVRRTERWGLPPTAVREAVINAVVHADYAQRGAPIRVAIFDDRLEVENPGLLPFGLTIEDLRHGISKLRNRVLGRVFYILGLIEQWGSGIARMTTACRDAGLEAPRLEEIGTHFRVTLYSATKYKPRVDQVEKAILEAMVGGKGLSTQEIAAKIKLSTRATRTRLLALVQRGLVAEVGTSPQDPTRKYFLVKREGRR
jgi:ATP-dependent DNA helicase RecG